jgi:hypothetical protein
MTKTFHFAVGKETRELGREILLMRGKLMLTTVEKAMIECLGRYSQQNIPMLLLEESSSAVETIWQLAGRQLHITLDASITPVSEVIHYAQANYDSILIRQVERWSIEQQAHLARVLAKMQSSERGKFILTTNDSKSLNPELKETLCKIEFQFKIREPEEYDTLCYPGNIG